MTYEDVPLAYINIHKGGVYSESWNLADEAGDPLLASAGWTGKAEIRTGYGGTLICTFAGSGGDGTVTFDELGNVTLEMTSTATAALSAASQSTNGRANGVIYLGDLEIWKTSTPTERWHAIDFRVRIYPEVTTS